jgi:CheY-like chemotaxis protein
VVDDDEGVREFVTACLQQFGCRIIAVDNPLEAIRIFRREQIDLVIFDIFMPDRDGIDMLMELRFMEPNVKAIAISGGGSMPSGQALRLAEKLGATVALAKPFSVQQLQSAVQSLLEPQQKAA